MRRFLVALSLVSLLYLPLSSVARAHGFFHCPPDNYFLAPGFALEGLTVVNLRDRDFDFYRDIRPVNADGTVNQVVEIPAGTNDKFEVDEATGKMSWELKNGVPRVIAYLGYPGNYGMVPRTISGDGDSLDILTIGHFEERGKVMRVKVIGVLRLIDGGEIDDKLIAVLPNEELGDVDSLAELDARFAGITTIIETWFVNYKGPGALQSGGFGDADEAWAVLQAAMAAY